MTNIVINGTRFLVNEDSSPINEVQLLVSETNGGPTSSTGTIAFRPGGPQAGSNPIHPSIVINAWTNTEIDIDYDPADLSPTDTWVSGVILVDENVEFYMFDLDPDQNAVEEAPLTYPLIESICSPSADTVRFEGERFLTATAGEVGTVIFRMADYTAGTELNGASAAYDFIDGNPDPVYDWVLVTHTDTVIEISNPRFSSSEPSAGPGDFVITGAAFHSPDYEMYFYEPWGETFSTPVDGSGCP